MRQPLSRTSVVLGTAALIALLVLVPVRAQGTKDIVDVAVAAGSFKTLVAAVQAANLVDVLKRPGPLTVLAPTDEAFAKIPKADLDALMKDKVKLAAVLQYHVLAGNVSAESNVMSATPIATVGFWGTYRNLGGRESGGCSTTTAPFVLAGLLVSVGVLGSIRRRHTR